MNQNYHEYEKELENSLRKFLKILNDKLSLGLTNHFVEKCIIFFKDISNSIKAQRAKRKLEIFHENLPIKKPEYLAVALIYFLLNYKKDPIKIKIGEYAQITSLTRQNIRRVLKFLASFDEVLSKYDIVYNPRTTYHFNEVNYINQVNSYIKKFYFRIWKELNLSTENSKKEIKFLINIYFKAINSIKDIDEKNKLKIFYESLSNKVKDPKYLAAVVCYIYLRFFKDIYIEQNEFVKLLNSIKEINFVFDSFSRTYSNFSKNYLRIDKEAYRARIIHWLEIYINKINENEKFHLELPLDFIELLDLIETNKLNF